MSFLGVDSLSYVSQSRHVQREGLIQKLMQTDVTTYSHVIQSTEMLYRKILRIWTSKIITVIVLKLIHLDLHCGNVHKFANGMSNSVDHDHSAPHNSVDHDHSAHKEQNYQGPHGLSQFLEFILRYIGDKSWRFLS